MPKSTTPTSVRQGRRHNPLEDDLLATGPLRTKAPKRKSKDDDGEDQEHQFVDSKASKKILQIGRELAEEDEGAPPPPALTESNAFGFDSRFDLDDEDNDPFGEGEAAWGDEEELVEEIDIEPEDLDTFNKFMPTEEDPLLQHGWGGQNIEQSAAPGTGMNLADIIMAKIAAHESGNRGEAEPMEDDDYELPEKVVEVYTQQV
jgi:essential nuclear protein 1